MTYAARLSSLNTKHEKIEQEIKQAYSSHLPNEELHNLKKQKLAIKDKISDLIKNLS